MESDEITKLVDGIYKNILDKFNPGARQLINAGKAYLKALHGAAGASKLYVEAITKLARQAQQGTWGGSSDIGSALMQIVEVYREIQSQQMNILKKFYVDLLVPLETNLEKDTKVVQSEQKKFMHQHKQRYETYSKAAATMKKQRKKNRSSKTGVALDKELKSMQILEEEKSKLDGFCEQSLKDAITQERRRYGFVLERQCSLAKHYLAFHTQGSSMLQRHLDEWQEVSKTREYLPEAVESMFTNRLRQVTFWQDDDIYATPRALDDDRLSINSQLRKTKSMDASCLDVRSINDVTGSMPLSRAKSEFNLTASNHSLAQDPDTPTRPKSMAVPETSNRGQQLARAMYAYLSSGDNQLSFLEGDIIALLGERNKGWQFGENLRTQRTGWFPLAYTELIISEDESTVSSPNHQRIVTVDVTPNTPTNGVSSFGAPSFGNSSLPATSPVRPVTMFGDTLLQRVTGINKIRQATSTSTSDSDQPPPPPPVPAPTTTAPHPQDRRQPPPVTSPLLAPGHAKRAIGNVSLHSSNDSGFSNDPPPQPEVDYSDEDSPRTNSSSPGTSPNPANNTGKMSSVKGWLLYKSALELWDDVDKQANNSETMTLNRHPLTARQSSSVDHLATMGRHGNREPHQQAQSELMPLGYAKYPYEKHGVLKRTKSLWKFKRSKESIVMEGMSLWQHRSLVDVSDPKLMEQDGQQPKLMKKDSTIEKQKGDTTTQRSTKSHKATNGNGSLRSNRSSSDSNLADVESCIVVNDHTRSMNQQKQGMNGNPDRNYLPRTRLVKVGSKVQERQSMIKEQQLKERPIQVKQSQMELQDQPKTKPPPHPKLHPAKIPNQVQAQRGRILRQAKLQQNLGDDDEGDGLFSYGEKLHERLYKPERGSRFDQISERTGNMCGPWYDLWGIDASVQYK